MIRQVVTVENRLGLHARAAAKLVRVVRSFDSNIQVTREGESQVIDSGSILALLMLAASQGTRLVFSIEGADEAQAGAAVRQLFEECFGEEG